MTTASAPISIPIRFHKSKWEAPDLALEPFLDRVKADGFDGSEIYVADLPDSAAAISAAHEERGLGLIAQVSSGGKDPEEHRQSFVRQLRAAAACQPLFINAHAGSDLFSLEDNLAILRAGFDLAKTLGVSLLIETHRGRPTFSGPGTRLLLEVLPEMRITADLSHWMCVHESLLHDQPENVTLAMQRADHIHARIGFEEGPQVASPMAPDWARYRERFLEIWTGIITLRQQNNRPFITVTPEAGPPPYMPILPGSRSGGEDAWESNVRVQKWLRQEWGIPTI